MSPALSYPRPQSGRKGGVSHRVVAIVPGAGYGRRLGLKIRKPFVFLGGKPLISYALKVLNDSGDIGSIIIAAEKSCVGLVTDLVKKFKFKKVIKVVPGGKTRFESVRNCLEAVTDDFDIVLIHDAARPFLKSSVIKKSIRSAKRTGACIVAIPESDTVKSVDEDRFVRKTLDRSCLFRAETPQVFRRAIIKKAYALGDNSATDDSSLVERCGVKVEILQGGSGNMKITTREDLKIAEALL